jgi:hypothetical protein
MLPNTKTESGNATSEVNKSSTFSLSLKFLLLLPSFASLLIVQKVNYLKFERSNLEYESNIVDILKTHKFATDYCLKTTLQTYTKTVSVNTPWPNTFHT